jgi:hypothetical protein
MSDKLGYGKSARIHYKSGNMIEEIWLFHKTLLHVSMILISHVVAGQLPN